MSNTILEIKQLMIDFSNENLNEEFKNKSIELLEKLEETNSDILNTSRTDIWSASILSVVLDMNGVFNKKHPMYMTKKDFAQRAGVSAGTIKNKADAVKEMLNLIENDDEIIKTSTEESTKEVEVKEDVAVTIEETVIEVNDEKEVKYQELMTLGHKSKDYKEKINYFEEAIKVAVEMIGQNTEVVYWEDEITRPYMIALEDLGNACLQNKDYVAGKKVYELLLNLNPIDNQGIRYKLVNLLISKNERKEINDLFLKYKDDKSAMWLYSKVLYYYKNNNQFMAKDALKDALNCNKYIALKLIKWTAFMQMSGVYINPVLFQEANYYCEQSIDVWKNTKGSIDWLLKNVLKK